MALYYFSVSSKTKFLFSYLCLNILLFKIKVCIFLKKFYIFNQKLHFYFISFLAKIKIY